MVELPIYIYRVLHQAFGSKGIFPYTVHFGYSGHPGPLYPKYTVIISKQVDDSIKLELF